MVQWSSPGLACPWVRTRRRDGTNVSRDEEIFELNQFWDSPIYDLGITKDVARMIRMSGRKRG